LLCPANNDDRNYELPRNTSRLLDINRPILTIYNVQFSQSH